MTSYQPKIIERRLFSTGRRRIGFVAVLLAYLKLLLLLSEGGASLDLFITDTLDLFRDSLDSAIESLLGKLGVESFFMTENLEAYAAEGFASAFCADFPIETCEANYSFFSAAYTIAALRGRDSPFCSAKDLTGFLAIVFSCIKFVRTPAWNFSISFFLKSSSTSSASFSEVKKSPYLISFSHE